MANPVTLPDLGFPTVLLPVERQHLAPYGYVTV